MPIYEFKCNKCGDNFEELVFPSDNIDDLKCPSCGEHNISKLISCFASGSGDIGAVGGDSISTGCSPKGGFS